MAGGKETPRQKMIGMMYLVLTALLALNVSKSILDAFVAIEENIQVANENEFYRGEEKEALIEEKANDDSSIELKQKAIRLLKVAREIDNMTAQRIREIDELKLEILKEGGENITDFGPEHILQAKISMQQSIQPIRLKLDYVNGQDKYDEPMRIMLGSETDIKRPSGKGKKMYENYMNFRNQLVEILAKSSSNKEHTYQLKMPNINRFKNEKDKLDQITKALSTQKVSVDDVDVIRKIYASLTKNEFQTVHEQENVHWLGRTFDHAPVVAALASLSSLQKEILTARADAIATIQARIGGGEYSFNKIMPLAYGPEYANQNEEVELEVLMAAYDSDKRPEITVNGGRLKEIKAGKGRIVAKGSGNEMKVSGTITIRNKSGLAKTLPWEKTIQLIKPQGVVSLPMMNVLYRGYDNQIAASASGYPEFKLVGQGVNVIKNGKDFTGKINTTGRTASIAIMGINKTTGKSVNLGKFDFRVMNLPRPSMFFGTSGEGDKINPTETKLFVKYGPEIPLNVNFRIKDWKLSLSGVAKSVSGSGNTLNTDGVNLLRQGRTGMLATFILTVEGPDRGSRIITASFPIR